MNFILKIYTTVGKKKHQTTASKSYNNVCTQKKKNGSLNFISVHNILELIKGMKPPDT